MTDFLQQASVMLATLAILIAFHEWGHFWVARRCGVKVLRFSIGFGPTILTRKDKMGTEFSLSLLPLGGYVKMLDEREGEVTDAERSLAFNRKPVVQRMAIVAAGPVANFLLAIVVYWFVFLPGTSALKPVVYSVDANSIAEEAGFQEGLEITAVDGHKTETAQAVLLQLLDRIGDSGVLMLSTVDSISGTEKIYHLTLQRWLSEHESDVDPLRSLGLGFYQPQIKPIIAQVMTGSAAEIAGLMAGDELIAMDDSRITDWQQWVTYVQSRGNVVISLQYRRDNQTYYTDIKPELVEQKGRSIGQVGIRVDVPKVPEQLLHHQHYNFLTAWLPALQRTWDTAAFSLNSLKKMLLGDISYKQLSGPISIAKIATQSAQSGIYSYLSLLALLSVSLGVLNLLPIPVLDGGHLFFYIIEWLKGSPVSEKIQMVSFQIGMAVVMSVMILAVINDIGRL